ncbi:MAG: tetratricopeptide repeat protein [Pyrinomonadaceae bacterium]|jgi:tetratricopeptide (TPR) repeat protein|nr:tetratricopeptide repeat protein [Pyrinomonadaceae bacterium]
MRNIFLFIFLAFTSLNLACNSSEQLVSEKVSASEMPIESAKNYNKIAADFIRKARETGDFVLNTNAENAVKKALEIEPENWDSQKLQASLHLTLHRFDEALKLGKTLQQSSPSDSFVYGILTDANVELGNYTEAVEAVQKMVDLKPNMSSYARVGYVRSLHGDSVGAIDAMKLAAKTADPNDKESQAWCLVHLGDEFFKSGKFTEAEKVYDEALKIFPNYAAAMVGKGRVRMANNDSETAIKLLTEAQNRQPLTETVITLGDIYAKLKQTDKAKQQYDLAETIEAKFDNTDQRRLALLWADNDQKLDDALAIAEREHANRKDIFTADIFAWCLYKKGRLTEAKVAIDEAMRLNNKDARFFYHAGMIEKGLGNKKEAKRLLNLALQTNPMFDFGQNEKLKTALQELK